jgi:hypothetical protein
LSVLRDFASVISKSAVFNLEPCTLKYSRPQRRSSPGSKP